MAGNAFPARRFPGDFLSEMTKKRGSNGFPGWLLITTKTPVARCVLHAKSVRFFEHTLGGATVEFSKEKVTLLIATLRDSIGY